MSTTSHRTERARRISTIGHAGVAVAARGSRVPRRQMSDGARAALMAYAPGTVLKAGSADLAAADLWTLVMAGTPGGPRLVREGNGR